MVYDDRDRPSSTSRSWGREIYEGVAVCDKWEGQDHMTSHLLNVFYHTYETTWNRKRCFTFCCNGCILTEDVTSINSNYNATWSFKFELTFVVLKFHISTPFTLKCPLQNQCNTRVCQIIGSLVFLVIIVSFPFLLSNPTVVNEKATDKWCLLYNCLV